MKKFNFIFAIAMMVVAAASVAVVSCKKDTTGQDNAKGVAAQAFDPRQIEDMNAYLKDFKQKMQSAAKGDDEALSLEDAAWHLSSLANYDFGHANVDFDAIRFDTLRAFINVMNGKVLLSDLANAYENISTSLDKFYHSLMLENKHYRFIETTVSEDGEVVIPLMVTYSSNSKYLSDTCWYYDSEWDALINCDTYFNDYTSYPAATTAVRNWNAS